MPNYLSPGVYVEEVEAGSRPIEGVGTAVAGFVGLAARGPTNAPTLITNWAQFVNAFGDFIEGSYLAHAVYGYFLNGGGACYVVRIGGDSPMPQARAELSAAKDGSSTSYRVLALEPGPAGNQIKVDVTEATGAEGDTFNLTVSAPGREPPDADV
jgi:phage tail sheath protein FI